MIPEAVVCRKLLFATRVTHTSSIHAVDDPKLGVWSPESAKGKRCGLKILGDSLVDLRNRWRGCFGEGLHR